MVGTQFRLRDCSRRSSFEICRLEGRSSLSDTSHLNWREVFARARQERDPARTPEVCARARRLIQNRQLELATFSRIHDEEIAELEAALRQLWMMENKNGKD